MAAACSPARDPAAGASPPPPPASAPSTEPPPKPATEAPATDPGPASSPPAPTPDIEDWPQIALTPGEPPCARLGEPRDGQQLCRHVDEAGAEGDDLERDEAGTFELHGGPAIVETITYDRVRTEGAAGSRYETFFFGGEPVLVLRSCMIHDEKLFEAGWEGYAPCELRLPPSSAGPAPPGESLNRG